MSELAADLARGLDPVTLARSAGFDPDPWQRDVLRSDSDRIILNCSRQAGKSTVAALKGVHAALYEPGSLVLLLSAALRQSQELFNKAKGFYKGLGRPVASEQESALSLTLENGSRIVSLPGTENTVRGYSGVRLLVVDEASRVDDELYHAVRPMLAVSGGRLVLLSTPYGRRGFFWEAWTSSERWERYKVPAEDVPRIDAGFLEEERRSSGDWWVRQEYECEFMDAATAAFGMDDIEAAFGAEEVEAWEL